jgi:hypothetical protein
MAPRGGGGGGGGGGGDGAPFFLGDLIISQDQHPVPPRFLQPLGRAGAGGGGSSSSNSSSSASSAEGGGALLGAGAGAAGGSAPTPLSSPLPQLRLQQRQHPQHQPAGGFGVAQPAGPGAASGAGRGRAAPGSWRAQLNRLSGELQALGFDARTCKRLHDVRCELAALHEGAGTQPPLLLGSLAALRCEVEVLLTLLQLLRTAGPERPAAAVPDMCPEPDRPGERVALPWPLPPAAAPEPAPAAPPALVALLGFLEASRAEDALRTPTLEAWAFRFSELLGCPVLLGGSAALLAHKAADADYSALMAAPQGLVATFERQDYLFPESVHMLPRCAVPTLRFGLNGRFPDCDLKQVDISFSHAASGATFQTLQQGSMVGLFPGYAAALSVLRSLLQARGRLANRPAHLSGTAASTLLTAVLCRGYRAGPREPVALAASALARFRVRSAGKLALALPAPPDAGSGRVWGLLMQLLGFLRVAVGALEGAPAGAVLFSPLSGRLHWVSAAPAAGAGGQGGGGGGGGGGAPAAEGGGGGGGGGGEGAAAPAEPASGSRAPGAPAEVGDLKIVGRELGSSHVMPGFAVPGRMLISDLAELLA